MAIKRRFTGDGGHLQPGEHVVTIVEVKVGQSKQQKPMLTVKFENAEFDSIKGFYVRELPFHMEQLTELKLACGLAADSDATNLGGRKVGIAVELSKKPDAKGRFWTRIVGYGKPEDVEQANEHEPPPYDSRDEIPF